MKRDAAARSEVRRKMKKMQLRSQTTIRLAVCMLVASCLALALQTPAVERRARARVPLSVEVQGARGASARGDASRTTDEGQGSAKAETRRAEEDDDEASAFDEDEVVTINASEVLLPVTVRDENGALVKNLTREDFRVFEEGREQPLSDIGLRRAPVDVALLVDASSSVASSFDDFRAAAEEFASRLDPEDRFCLIKFDDRIELLLDWSRSRHQLSRALRRLTPGVFTRFNDALALAAREQFGDGRRRQALVILSDGIDSGRGANTHEAALRALLESQVGVYAISNTEIERARKRAELDALLAGPDSARRFNELRIGDLTESLRILDVSERNLARLTEATGGRLYTPKDFSTLDRVYQEIADELRHQYALYYSPTDDARDGRFRRVRVEVTSGRLRVTSRVGYFAPRRLR